jgi:hypothetical protein
MIVKPDFVQDARSGTPVRHDSGFGFRRHKRGFKRGLRPVSRLWFLKLTHRLILFFQTNPKPAQVLAPGPTPHLTYG